jgi:hypothetical protein
LRLIVGCTKFPNMGDGQIGFASRKEDHECMMPRYPYLNGDATGYIHTRNHVELFAIAKQIGAMPKNQFIEHHGIKPSGPWKNDYISYIDKEIERALLKTGIRLTIDGIEVEFYTEPGYYKNTDIKPSKRFKEMYGGSVTKLKIKI